MEILELKKDFPLDLLLDADPNQEYVEDYLERGQVFGLFDQETPAHLIGVYVLLKTRPGTMELVNLAVREAFRGQGYGRMLTQDALTRAKEAGMRTLEVGTANSSLGPLALYLKCGFRMTHLDLDFFRRHYPDPIFENGVECRDMVRLMQDL
ncbi:GNAT family N-acetyltransferase [Listeria kieliensis]|uniref:Acetyltransferase n=1 Tax=Listeria kieliensis TaxID=1621700 RepID=A0A3D8TTW0_9LIST|nr:GNAT family N-acetyltransferase [Listeria kieliensis]RDX02239.1 acetyltransferase [Listeria kieliensis]